MTRYRLDPVFDRTSDRAVKGILRYDIYLNGCFVGSRSKHAQCHAFLDELMRSTSEVRPRCSDDPSATWSCCAPRRWRMCRLIEACASDLNDNKDGWPCEYQTIR